MELFLNNTIEHHESNGDEDDVVGDEQAEGRKDLLKRQPLEKASAGFDRR